MNTINTILTYVFRLLFPVSCIGCKRKGTAYCTSCFKKLRRAFPVPLPHTLALYPYNDSSIKKILWEAKYHHNTKPLEALIALSVPDILEYLSHYTLSEKNTPLVFIPIPTNSARKKNRGYNIPTLIAKYTAQESGGKCLDVLVKTRETIPQSKTTRRESRFQNVAHSLALKTNVSIPNNTLLILIDDICFRAIVTGKQIGRAHV